MHYGTDLKAVVGTNVVTIYGGVVHQIKNTVPNDQYSGGVDSLGNFVIIYSEQVDISLMYCHQQSVDIRAGQTITVGIIIGKSGRSGNAFNVTNKHLHVEASKDKFAAIAGKVDAETYLKTTYASL